MDIEWGKDGRTGELFILQARPETVISQCPVEVMESYRLKEKGKVLLEGRSVGERIAAGPVRVIETAAHLHEFKPGEILVTDKTDPDWEPIMKQARGIVTNRGGRTCHAAIVSRELGVPAVVGAAHATERLPNGAPVIVSCAEGETGKVYEGELAFEVDRVDFKEIERPRTKIMLNLANPQEAFGLSFLPNDGGGLARMEFIIANWIRIHPMALLREHGWKEAEFAIVISDARQSQGLVNELMESLIDVARREGVQQLSGTVLTDNTAMLHLCKKHGFKLNHVLGERETSAVLDL